MVTMVVVGVREQQVIDKAAVAVKMRRLLPLDII
jgi:hypothetical protein